MRVIVVDDDKLVCVSLKTILEADSDISVVGTGYSSDVFILKSVIFYYTNQKNTPIKHLIIREKTFKIKIA